jgi:hypothetical protein
MHEVINTCLTHEVITCSATSGYFCLRSCKSWTFKPLSTVVIIYHSNKLVKCWKKNEKKCTSSLLWSSLFWSITGGFNGTFNNISVISWRSVLLAEETGVARENHWTVASHWQTLSHNVVSSTPCMIGSRTNNISGDRHWLHR